MSLLLFCIWQSYLSSWRLYVLQDSYSNFVYPLKTFCKHKVVICFLLSFTQFFSLTLVLVLISLPFFWTLFSSFSLSLQREVLACQVLTAQIVLSILVQGTPSNLNILEKEEENSLTLLYFYLAQLGIQQGRRIKKESRIRGFYMGLKSLFSVCCGSSVLAY